MFCFIYLFCQTTPLTRKIVQHERTNGFVTNATEKPVANSHGINSNRSWENPTSDFCMSGMQETDRAMILEAASAAMDELVELLRVEDPLWISSANDGRSTLHRDSYDKLFPKPNHFKSAAARIESSKESGEVAMPATTLLEAFLDPVKWKDMFPSIVTKARTIQVLDAGISFNGSLHLVILLELGQPLYTASNFYLFPDVGYGLHLMKFNDILLYSRCTRKCTFCRLWWRRGSSSSSDTADR